MTAMEKFLDALKQNMTGPAKFPSIVQGSISEVGEKSCKVKLTANGLELEDVLYNATDENEGGFVLVPKIDTNVLVGTIGGDENSMYLVAMDEIETVKLIIDQSEITFDKDGWRSELSSGKYTVKNNVADLKQCLLDFVSMVRELTVSTANGPSGPPLTPTLSQAQALETSINSLFN